MEATLLRSCLHLEVLLLMRHEWIEKVSFLVDAGWQTRAPGADFIAFFS